MRKVVIGRGHECDVIVDDVTDVVSRRQAVIAFTPLGRMTIYDLSTNGTYVNGVRVPKPSGYPLKRTDKVNFGSVCEFDLNRVKDPYRGMKIIIAAIFVVMIAAVVATLLITGRQNEIRTDDDLQPAVPEIETVVEKTAPVPETKEETLTEGQTDITPEPAVKTAKPSRKAVIRKDAKNSTDKLDTPDDAQTEPAAVGDYSKEKDSDELNGKY